MLADLDVSCGVETWKNTKGKAGKSDHFCKQGNRKERTNYQRTSLLSLPEKVYAKCLEKKC